MAINARDLIQPVLTLTEVVALFLLLMAIQASLIGDAGRFAFRVEYLRGVAAAIDVFLSRPVTGFAAFH